MEYKFARVELLKDSNTNEVKGIVIGMTAIDGNYTGYIDGVKNFGSPYKTADQYTVDEIRQICLDFANHNKWYDMLSNIVNNQKNIPINQSVSGI